MSSTPAVAASTPRISRLSVFSWALYDLANTIFSMNIVSLYFGLWVVNEMAGTDANYGNANSISMALMFLSAPVLGALSDQAGRRMPFLIITTLLCVTFTALLGVGGLIVSLLVFVIANYMFQAGLIFYDSLLPTVSTEENRGKVGGFGVGLGYMGSFIGVGSGLLLLSTIGYTGIFRLSAVLFLIFAIPCFLFVKEQPTQGLRGLGSILRAAYEQTYAKGLRTISNWPRYFAVWAIIGLFQGVLAVILISLPGGQARWWFPLAGIAAGLLQSIILLPVVGPLLHARKYPGLTRFLAGRIFYTDPINTIIVFMGIYVTNEVGFSESEAQIVLLVSIAAAVMGGFGWGFVVDRIGPKRSLNLVLLTWMGVLSLAILIAVLSLPPDLFWVVACVAGIALGGTWAADRPYMLRLSPPRYVGEFYGLYSMVGRFASIIGPFTWGYIADTLGLGRPAAIASLLVFIIIAFVVLQGVNDQVRQWSPEHR